MNRNTSQEEKAKRFHHLHYAGSLLVLPNIWDSLGALLLADVGYPAIATASAAIAFANGYSDGEKIPFKELLSLLKKITACVALPVSADIESGYAKNDEQLQQNIKALITAGIVGINIEDTDNETDKLLSIEKQSHKIKLIRTVADEMNMPIFINARTDVYLHPEDFITAEEKLTETIKRGLAYKEAGADGFYPITVIDENHIKEIMTQVKLPVNLLTMPGLPGLKRLNDLGVARVSLGPGFLKIAVKAMRELAIQLKQYDGLPTITSNEIKTDYLERLVADSQ